MPATDKPPTRRSRAVDPATRALRWAKNGRSREAQLYRSIARRLCQHVGGKPNHAEALLIGRIAMLQIHLAHIDERAIQDGGLSPHATREYLAWSNTLAKLIGRLGLRGAQERMQPSLADYLGAKAAATAASGVHTAPGTSSRHPPAAASVPSVVGSGGPS
jgi:hypothetical protein